MKVTINYTTENNDTTNPESQIRELNKIIENLTFIKEQLIPITGKTSRYTVYPDFFKDELKVTFRKN